MCSFTVWIIAVTLAQVANLIRLYLCVLRWYPAKTMSCILPAAVHRRWVPRPVPVSSDDWSHWLLVGQERGFWLLWAGQEAGGVEPPQTAFLVRIWQSEGLDSGTPCRTRTCDRRIRKPEGTPKCGVCSSESPLFGIFRGDTLHSTTTSKPDRSKSHRRRMQTTGKLRVRWGRSLTEKNGDGERAGSDPGPFHLCLLGSWNGRQLLPVMCPSMRQLSSLTS
jgi:hypothetical protein